MKLSIWVTKTCNMACSYCYEEGGGLCNDSI